MGTFTPAIWSTSAWTEKFNIGLGTYYSQLLTQKFQPNKLQCELALPEKLDLKYSKLTFRSDIQSTDVERTYM